MSRLYTIPLIAVGLLECTEQIVVEFWSLEASERRDELTGAVFTFALVHHDIPYSPSGLNAESKDGIFLHPSGSTAVEGILSLALMLLFPSARLLTALLFMALVIVTMLLQHGLVLVVV